MNKGQIGRTNIRWNRIERVGTSHSTQPTNVGHRLNHLEPKWLFPTKYGTPKSLMVGHWLSQSLFKGFFLTSQVVIANFANRPTCRPLEVQGLPTDNLRQERDVSPPKKTGESELKQNKDYMIVCRYRKETNHIYIYMVRT